MKTFDCEQRSPQWYALRCGTPTASEFSNLLTDTGKRSASLARYARKLAGESFAGTTLDQWDGNAWTERGREMEDEALRLYEYTSDHIITRIGFVTTDDETAGCSPDAFVGDDGMVEVKVLKSDNHVEAAMHFVKTGGPPPGYAQQTQGQLWICERKWCDLLFFHPRLPLIPIRITPNEKWRADLKDAVADLIVERDAALAALLSLQTPLSIAAE